MMKLTNLLTIIFLIIVGVGYSQPTYPIQTVLKGDSVVILTKKQSKEIDLLIDNQKIRIQKYKTEIKNLTDTNYVLKQNIQTKDSVIDSLNNMISNINYGYDSLINRLDTLESWILMSSIDNGYLYYSWQDSTIKVIDLSLYMLIGHKKTGNYSLIVRDEVMTINLWKERNLINIKYKILLQS